MECRLRIVGKNYHVAFRVGLAEMTHSLRTKNKKEAEVRVGVIRDTLYRIDNGTLVVPSGADPKAFILAGGKVFEKPKPTEPLTLGKLANLYLENVQGIEPNTRLTITIHLNHLQRIVGPNTPAASLHLPEINGYALGRSKEKFREAPISGQTIRKELQTLRSILTWGVEQGVVGTLDWMLKTVKLPKDRGREPFRSYVQIERMIERGGISLADEVRLWETLYLTSGQVSELLIYVARTARLPWVYPMITFVALTGCRRSEMVRSEIDDWDFEAGHVHIREKKRDTSKEFTLRQVNLHPTLTEVMQAWLTNHPGGKYTFTSTGRILTPQKTTEQLRRTLEPSPRWSKVRGFHTLRHSVASILASKGVDQRYIDKLMGHQTEEMRLRYQHLFPKGIADAIESLLEK